MTKRHHFKPSYNGQSCEHVVRLTGMSRAGQIKQFCCARVSDPVHFPNGTRNHFTHAECVKCLEMITEEGLLCDDCSRCPACCKGDC